MNDILAGRRARLLLLLAITLLAASAWLLIRDSPSVEAIVDMRGEHEVVVVLTEEGFTPSLVAIAPGTTVTFTTERSSSFWPASDLHPMHATYPAFDPRAPVAPASTWSFTFEKVGGWSYHDHLSPIETGLIIVASISEDLVSIRERSEACEFATTDKMKLACFSAQIHYTLETRGLDAAFETLKKMYARNPDIVESCHGYAHDIGLNAFRIWGKNVPLISKVGYCNDGFFHGYMEGFFIEHDSAEAREFCDRVRARFDSVYRYAGQQCDHGIGHGVGEQLLRERPDLAGDLPRLIDIALSVCAAEAEEENLDRCASGVHSVVGDWIIFRMKHKTFFTKSDPYALCKRLTEQWAQHGCIWEFSKRIKWLFPNDLDPREDFTQPIRLAISEGSTIAEGVHLGNIVRSMAHTSTYQYVLREPAFLVALCRDISNEPLLQEECIIGVMSGLFGGGRPEQGGERAVAFCTSEQLSESERVRCGEVLLEIVGSSHEAL